MTLFFRPRHQLRTLLHRLLRTFRLAPLSVLRTQQSLVCGLEARNHSQYLRLNRYNVFLHHIVDGYKGTDLADKAKELLSY